jgi:hypothetical protein
MLNRVQSLSIYCGFIYSCFSVASAGTAGSNTVMNPCADHVVRQTHLPQMNCLLTHTAKIED